MERNKFEGRELQHHNKIKIETCPLELVIRRYLVISRVGRLSAVVRSEIRLLGDKTQLEVSKMEIMNVDMVLGREGESMVVRGVGAYTVFCFLEERPLNIFIGQGEETS